MRKRKNFNKKLRKRFEDIIFSNIKGMVSLYKEK